MDIAWAVMIDAKDFVRRFEAWWADPDPSQLGDLLAPDVVLVQPIVAHTRDLEGAKRTFTALLAAIPDLKMTVRNWASEGDAVIIEFTLAGTLGGKPFVWDNVDRFTVNTDGLATERVNYHNSMSTTWMMLSRPNAWRQLWRSGILKR
jgi:ketosteroid isomerase-like protein